MMDLCLVGSLKPFIFPPNYTDISLEYIRHIYNVHVVFLEYVSDLVTRVSEAGSSSKGDGEFEEGYLQLLLLLDFQMFRNGRRQFFSAPCCAAACFVFLSFSILRLGFALKHKGSKGIFWSSPS